MWTVSGLFDTFCSPEHLERALALTVRGKTRAPDVAWLLFRREGALEALRQQLLAGRWAPARLEWVRIRDPKPRLIARVPILDRVVHTALVKVLEPALTRSLRPEAMACRPGLGTHRAALRLLALQQRHRYAVHLDIRAYFPSIDPATVRALLARRVRDRRLLAVVDRVLDGGAGLYTSPAARAAAGLGPRWPPPGRGLPIGAYTSQVFAAHLVLDALDHHIKRDLKVPGYVRYVDDLFLFGDRRAALRGWREAVGRWLWAERGLRLKHPQARVLSCRGHLDALGWRIRREGLTARPRVLRRLRRRVRAWLGGARRPDPARALASVAGVVLF